jgi:hypothetical protein
VISFVAESDLGWVVFILFCFDSCEEVLNDNQQGLLKVTRLVAAPFADQLNEVVTVVTGQYKLQTKLALNLILLSYAVLKISQFQ